ncbi:MAG: hypothetical protein V1705_00590 [bacterium]
MNKYKYYFKKPKSEISKDIVKGLLVGGAVCISAASPYFASNLMRAIRQSKKYERKRFYDTFYRLKKRGCIKFEKKNHQIYISLTDEGRKKAGIYQINDLEIKKPKKWDGRWRIILFDISEVKKIKREAFRGKLKELGFYPFQKSAWIHPYDCRNEVELLKDFFGLGEQELRLIVAQDIGENIFLRNIFKI